MQTPNTNGLRRPRETHLDIESVTQGWTTVRCAAVALFTCGASLCVSHAALILSDNFTRANNFNLGTTPVGGFAWTETEVSAANVAINANNFRFDPSADNQRNWATLDLSGAAGYSTRLQNNAGLVTWSANFRYSIYSDGFDSGDLGIAFVLAASSADLTTGSGYAVVWGRNDPENYPRCELVRFTDGLDADVNLTRLVAGPSHFENGGSYLDIRVTLDPSTLQWVLYAKADGTAYGDPDDAPWRGSATDSTYTGQALGYTGFLQNVDFGTVMNYVNLVELEVVPEPATWGLICGIGLLGGAWLRRCTRGVRACAR